MITKHSLFAGILKNVRVWHLTLTLRNPVQKILSAYDHFLDRLEKNKMKGRLDKKEEFYSWSEFVHFLAANKPKQTSNKLFLNPKFVGSGGSPFVDDRIRWVRKNINTKKRHANVRLFV